MLNAAWRGAGRLGVAEEVGEADFGLDDVGVRVGSQARGRHERDMDRLPASERAAEGGDFVEELLPVVRGDGERLARVLHFAQVDDAVGPVEHQVDLRAGFAVGSRRDAARVDGRRDAGNAEGSLDLRDVEEADLFERQPSSSSRPTSGVSLAFVVSMARNLRKNRRKVNRNPTSRRLCHHRKTGEKSEIRMEPAAFAREDGGEEGEEDGEAFHCGRGRGQG